MLLFLFGLLQLFCTFTDTCIFPIAEYGHVLYQETNMSEKQKKRSGLPSIVCRYFLIYLCKGC